MISFDTNIVVHAANADSPHWAEARTFLEEAGQRKDVVLCELVLVEVFLKLCNDNIFSRPLSADEAWDFCERLRRNRNWRLVDSAPVMDEVWKLCRGKGFPFRRIIDLRLGLTLRHFRVEEFATTNGKDFQSVGFRRVWNPLLKS
ncbi:MAG: PIN domain-containing protein [Verrucomicrobia bacterium]|nr:PIN domain-containing protein [Verrucomicrobiota bacterium]